MDEVNALLGLAERCEKAEGPDRELDALIRCAAAREYELDMRLAKRLGAVTANYEGGGHSTWLSPCYTASLDAVRTLIDPADEWELSTMYCIARATVGLNRDHQTSWPGNGEHQACDPVLALLAAALRALASDRREMAEKALLGGRER
jgi:hypothetical protein